MSRKCNLVQNTLDNLFANMKANKKSKLQCNIISSPITITISSESDSGLSDTDVSNECRGTPVKRRLFEDSSIGNGSSPEKNPKLMVVNKPCFQSTPIKSENDEGSSSDTIIQNSPPSIIVLQNVAIMSSDAANVSDKTKAKKVCEQDNSIYTVDENNSPELPKNGFVGNTNKNTCDEFQTTSLNNKEPGTPTGVLVEFGLRSPNSVCSENSSFNTPNKTSANEQLKSLASGSEAPRSPGSSTSETGSVFDSPKTLTKCCSPKSIDNDSNKSASDELQTSTTRKVDNNKSRTSSNVESKQKSPNTVHEENIGLNTPKKRRANEQSKSLASDSDGTESPELSTSKKSFSPKSVENSSDERQTSTTYKVDNKKPRTSSIVKSSDAAESNLESPNPDREENIGLNTPKKNRSIEQSKSSTSPGSPEPSTSKTGSTYGSPKKFRTPVKRMSPSKKGSPKKEHGPPIERYLKTISDLFEKVSKARFVKDLLKAETKVLKIFLHNDLSEKYKFTCLKLFTYKHKWYNIFKFCQKININLEQNEVMDLYKFLKRNQIIDSNYINEGVDSLLTLLDLADVKAIHSKFKFKRSAKTKEEMIQVILKYCNSQSTLTSTKSSRTIILNEVKERMGYCVKAHDNFLNAFFNIYLLGTFTNSLFWNISDYFNLIMHQNIAFPNYTTEDFCVFYSRTEFLNYSKAQKYYYDLDNAFQEKNHVQASLLADDIFKELKHLHDDTTGEKYQQTPHLKRFTAKSVYLSALTHATKPLMTKFPEKVKEWLEYLIKNYNSHRSGTWYYNLSWLYMRYLPPFDYRHAASLVVEALKNKDIKNLLSEVQRYNLLERGQQLITGKKYKITQLQHDTLVELVADLINVDELPTVTIDASAIRSSELAKHRSYIVQDSEGNKAYMRVEDNALEYYIKEMGYTDGRHCEGRIVVSTFALFFWDIIYNPQPSVPATFLSSIQQEPLDMKTPYFYSNRKELIDRRLKEIESDWTEEQLIKFARDNYNLHSHETGISNITSQITDEDLLETLVTCMGRVTLSKIYKRLVKNVSTYSSGMPDLLLWNVEKKTCRFVEVKGEGDRLSSKQKLWLKYLVDIGAEAEVCLVHSTGSKRKVKKDIKSKTVEVKRKKSTDQPSTSKKKNSTKQPSMSKEKTSREQPSMSEERNSDDDFCSEVTNIVKGKKVVSRRMRKNRKGIEASTE